MLILIVKIYFENFYLKKIRKNKWEKNPMYSYEKSFQISLLLYIFLNSKWKSFLNSK